MKNIKNTFRLLAMTLIISGTSIGGSILIQPANTRSIGFIPAFLIIIASWWFMTSTALFLAEICISFKENVHISTISECIFGCEGKYFVSIIYIFMTYTSLIAYVAGSNDLIQILTNSKYSYILLYTLILILFICMLKFSIKIINAFNIILFIGLIILYLLIILYGSEYISTIGVYNKIFNKYAIFSIPLFITGFSFQMIIPSLVNHLKKNMKDIKTSIISGTFLTVVIYIIWNAIMINITLMNNSSVIGYTDGRMPIYNITKLNVKFYIIIHWFSLFSLSTSIIGILWSFLDFLFDLIKTSFFEKYKYRLLVIILFVPIIVSHYNKTLFINIIESTGGYGDTLLNGVIPMLMYWITLNALKNKLQYSIFFKKIYICLLIIFSIFIIVIETVNIFFKAE